MVILCFLTYGNVHAFKRSKIVPVHLLYILFALILQSLAVFTLGVHAAFVSIKRDIVSFNIPL